MKYSKVKLRIQIWITATALSLSPLLAQDPPQAKFKNETRRLDNSLVGPSILSVLPARAAAVAPDSQDKPGGNGNSSGNSTKTTSPGKTHGALIGILTVAGGVVAAWLALSGKERIQSNPPAASPVGRVGTTVTPGTPTINPPSN